MRPALVALALALAVGLPGCWSAIGHREACFRWPSAVACPGEDVAVLYLGDAIDACEELTSIDSRGEHRGPRCCYQVSAHQSLGCNFEN